MKDKYKNIWKRSELRDLVKNILIYGDKWNLISEKTGSRNEEIYKKHAKRFFIKNSFILHRIYENENATTIETFFKFKKNFLILNFSTIKLKYKEFKPEKLNLIKRNFYKNLKSLGIETSYFDENYFENNFNENFENEEIYEVNENQSFAFTTNNNYTQSNYLEEQFDQTEDSYSESEKREENLTHISQQNQKKNGLNNSYFNNNVTQSNNFFSGFNNFNSNSFARNFGFQGFSGFTNENVLGSQIKDSNLMNFNNQNNNNNNLSFNNYFYNEKYENYENENDGNNENVTEDANDNNNINNNSVNVNFNNAYNININNPSNINNKSNYLFKNFKNLADNNNNNSNNNEAGNFQSRINENLIYNERERSEFKNLDNNNNNNKNRNDQQLQVKKTTEKDYNLISLRILKRFNSINRKNNVNKNENNTSNNNLSYNNNDESLEEDLTFIRPFYIEKIHGESRCKHNLPTKMQGNKRRKIRQAVRKETEKQEKIINLEEKNNNNNIKNNLLEKEIQDEKNLFKENIEDNEIKNDSNKEDTVNKCKKDNNAITKKSKSEEAFFGNTFNKNNNNNNKEDKKEEYINFTIDNISRKTSEIFRLDKDYTKKKMSANSILTQITQNNLNLETNGGEISPIKKPFTNKENTKNITFFPTDQEANRSFSKLTENNSNSSINNLGNLTNNVQTNNLNQTLLNNVSDAAVENKNASCLAEEEKEVTENNDIYINESNNDSKFNAKQGLFVQKKRLRNTSSAERKRSDFKPKACRKASKNCEADKNKYNNFDSKLCPTSESLCDTNILEMKNKENNIFNNQNQFERELNDSEFNFKNNEVKYRKDKLEVDETLSSNHSAVEDSKRNITTKNFDEEKACKSRSNKLQQQQEVKNDMPDFEKNYEMFNEKHNNNNINNNYSNVNSNLFVNYNNKFNSNNINNQNNFSSSSKININENSIQHNFFDKLSVLSDKGKSFVGTVNSATASGLNFQNFFPVNNSNYTNNNINDNNKNNFSFNNQPNNNNNNNFASHENNANLEFSLGNMLNFNNNNNTNKFNNPHNNNNNKFLQSTNLNDIYFNFNSKIAASLNSENYAYNRRSASRKNSAAGAATALNNKNETLTANNNNNNNNSENPNFKPGRKNESFRITKKYSEESSRLKLKESFSNPHLHSKTEDFMENNSPSLKNKNNFSSFVILKLSKEEKVKDLELKKLQKREAENEANNELSENSEESYFSYKTEFLEKADYNKPTIKALVSLRKLTFKKNSVDITINNNNNIIVNVNQNLNNQNKNSPIEKSPFADFKNENLELNKYKDLNPHNNNNQEKHLLSRKLSYRSRKQAKKLAENDASNANKETNQEEALNLQSKNSKCNNDLLLVNNNNNDNNSFKNCESVNPLLKESSIGGEIVRKDSFIITKEIRRKDTNLTNNHENKMSIDEGNLSFLKKNDAEKTLLLQPLRVNKKKQIFGGNQIEAIDESEYKNLKPTNSFYNNNDSSNTSLLQEKPAFFKHNFITFKDKSSNNTSHSLIAKEQDIDTIKSLRSNIEKTIPKKAVKANNNNNNQNSINANNNTNINNNSEPTKDSQIFTNFNSYIFDLDLLNKNNPNNALNPSLTSNNMNLIKPELYSNIIDLNSGNEIAQNFSKEKNSPFSYDNNFTKECHLFSEFNDELEYCMNSSNSDVSLKKHKILDDKVEKLISTVIQKQQNKNNKNNSNQNNNNFINKNNANLSSTKPDPNTNLSNISNNNNNNNNNFANLNQSNNNINNNSNINSNNTNNAFLQNELKFNVSNNKQFTNLTQNNLYKEKSEQNSFYIPPNNFDPLTNQTQNIPSNTANINPTNFFSGSASITTNNINNFHIINSSGPCIFPITHNITNYGNIMNHTTVAPQAPINKGDYKIQNQNFNIINDDGFNSDVNLGVYKIEKNFEQQKKKAIKYPDAELIESTVSNANKNSNKILENAKSAKSEKIIFNSVSGYKDKGVDFNNNNNNLNANAKEKSNFANLKNKNSSGNNNININNNSVNKNISMNKNDNVNNNAKDNCLTKIGNFSDFNLGNFNDGPITNKKNNNNNNNICSNLNSLNNNSLASYESLRVFEDKSNFMHDKRNQMNPYKPNNNNNNVYNSCNNYLIHKGTLISNQIQFSGFNQSGDNQAISFNNPNQSKEDFNFSDPFELNFHIDNKFEDQAIVNNKVENNNDDVFDMLGFN